MGVAYEHRMVQGRRPGLLTLVQFVETAAGEVTDSVYGIARRDPRPSSLKAMMTDMSDSVGVDTVKTDAAVSNANSAVSMATTVNSSHATTGNPCPICSGRHEPDRCELLLKTPLADRSEIMFKRGLCFRCLHPGHVSRECGSTARCGVTGCGRRHATPLHDCPFPERKRTEQRPQQQRHTAASTCVGGKKVALPIVPVRVSSPTASRQVTAYALLDTGSTGTFCSQELLDQLGIQGREEVVSLTTLEGCNQQCESQVVELTAIGVDFFAFAGAE